ncbi:MAG: septal ring lytic transglycosylase RlpA family protein [Treponema sp.]|nr:septal ring lytic transglycosylase RlpA family protein [Treponema sp.]
MKNIHVILMILVVAALFPFPIFAQETGVFRQEGIASWYGREFEGRPTASGEIFNASQLTAAHPNLPFGTMIVVTNLHNNKNVTVRVNDRGPFVPARIVDISRAAAERIDMITTGTAPVKLEVVGTAPASNSSPIVGAQMSTQISDAPQTVMPTILTAPILTPSLTSVPVPSVSQPIVPQINAAMSVPPVSVTQPVVPAPQIRLIPPINIDVSKNYRLQVGSFRVARHAVDVFDRLKKAGLNPNYERFIDNGNAEFYRVVLSGIRGFDIISVSEKISACGFREALIREEN